MKPPIESSTVTIQRVTDPYILKHIENLRRQAWAEDGEIPDFIANHHMDEDEHDLHGLHWAAMLGGTPIAAARLCVHPDLAFSPDAEAYQGYEHLIEGPVASLTRLVVLPAFRGRGVSEALRIERLRTAADHGCKSIIGCCEKESVMRAMEADGFIRLGPSKIRYLEAAPTIILLKRLS